MHFSVLVALRTGEEDPTLEQVLAPHHEYECTGEKDEYVVFVDTQEELEVDYAQSEKGCFVNTKTDEIVQNPQYNSKLKDTFWREATEEEFEAALKKRKENSSSFGMAHTHTLTLDNGNIAELSGLAGTREEDNQHYTVCKIFSKSEILASGEWIERDVSYSELYPSLTDFAIETQGYERNGDFRTVIDEGNGKIKFGRWTNPNAEWDWWRVGGRWSNSLKLKDGSWADAAFKKDIDFEGMQNELLEKKLPLFDLAQEQMKETGYFQSWADLMSATNEDGTKKYEDTRNAYYSQEGLKALHNRLKQDDIYADLDQFLVSREEFIEQVKFSAFSTYAILHDKKWLSEDSYADGWGPLAEEQREAFRVDYLKVLDSIPDDYLLVVVDCHK